MLAVMVAALLTAALSGCAAGDSAGYPARNVIPADAAYEYEIRELPAERDGKQIYGLLYLPENAGEEMPVVILSHGFGGDHRVGAQYAEAFAENGYAAYCFDFCGGGPNSRSSGSPTEMSILRNRRIWKRS